MNAQEEFESQIATCKCCLLAEAMKDCPLCRFNIGLAERVELDIFITKPVLEAIPAMALFAFAE
jgi:hypothetical protein